MATIIYLLCFIIEVMACIYCGMWVAKLEDELDSAKEDVTYYKKLLAKNLQLLDTKLDYIDRLENENTDLILARISAYSVDVRGRD